MNLPYLACLGRYLVFSFSFFFLLLYWFVENAKIRYHQETLEHCLCGGLCQVGGPQRNRTWVWNFNLHFISSTPQVAFIEIDMYFFQFNPFYLSSQCTQNTIHLDKPKGILGFVWFGDYWAFAESYVDTETVSLMITTSPLFSAFMLLFELAAFKKTFAVHIRVLLWCNLCMQVCLTLPRQINPC